jgi:hypothetical protein
MPTENKLGLLHGCGLMMTANPHPDAGKSPEYLEIGCTYECIPCLAKSRRDWSTRALAAEKKVLDFKRQNCLGPNFDLPV